MPDGAPGGWYPLSTSPLVASPLAPPATPPANAEIRVGENGYIHGIDGMLQQIARATMPHAGQMLVRDVLPVLQRDEALHTRVGLAMGTAIADRWKPWIVVGVSALGVLTGVQVFRYLDQRRAARSPTRARG